MKNLPAGPSWNQEDTLVADIDLAAVIEGHFDFDICGHYARPDVFTLLVNEQIAIDKTPSHLLRGVKS